MFILPFIQAVIIRLFLKKFNLKVCYPPPYSRQVWHLKEAETDLIRKELNDFNWERAFSNTNVNKKISILSKSVLNALSNFIPRETIICNEKDTPWFNSWIKFLLQAKSKIFKVIERPKPIFNCLINQTFSKSD